MQKDLDRERDSLGKVATRIYDLWKEIVELRKKVHYTNYDLKVHRGADQKDVLFNLVSKNVNAGENQWMLDRIKNATTSTSCHCRLIFDGVVVGTTPTKSLNYPNFEVDIFE